MNFFEEDERFWQKNLFSPKSAAIACNLFIFPFGYRAVDFGVIIKHSAGRILRHQGKISIAEIRRKIIQHLKRRLVFAGRIRWRIISPFFIISPSKTSLGCWRRISEGPPLQFRDNPPPLNSAAPYPP